MAGKVCTMDEHAMINHVEDENDKSDENTANENIANKYANESPPMISVIMGVYNQWDTKALELSVASILNQSFCNFEFIIYDDGSCQPIAEKIRQLKDRDKRIIVIGREENHGLAFSLNECIKHSKGKYIARMDADDISHPDRLRRQFIFLEKNMDYDWCGCNALLFDEEGIWGERRMPQIPKEKDFLKFSPYIHPSVMYRRKVFEEEGYLDSKDTLRCEDYEIFMRLSRRGLRGYNLQENLFEYRESMNSYKRRKFVYRINEAKIRYRNFKEMNILFPVGWMYVLRPIIGVLLPYQMNALHKHIKYRKSYGEARWRDAKE